MIHWNVDPEIFSVGFIHIRYYSLMFLLSFGLGVYFMKRFFSYEKFDPLDVDDLLMYMMAGTIIGARLGHVLFYSPGYYLSNPVEILMIWRGGLASHGAAVGILLALYYFSKRKGYDYLWIVDRIVIVVALSGGFIRLGNLFNSEIVGKPTDVPWAFIFERLDNIPRHPTQIYESLAYFIIFIFLYKTYMRLKEKTPRGLLFGYFLVGVFGFRFIVEFYKEVQESFERSLALDMGQILSIPLVLLGIYFLLTAKKRPPATHRVKKQTAKEKKKAKKKK